MDVQDKPGSRPSLTERSQFHPDGLRWLVCPVCKSALQLIAAENPNAIRCTGCARVYPVIDGLPILLRGRAVNGI